jgi:hypothetical protein
MIGLSGPGVQLCDGGTRREFLRCGRLGLAGLSRPSLLTARSAARGQVRPRAKACILLFMWGGPAQQEMFDLKPHAPVGVRSLFQLIPTRVPGTFLCEHLRRLAAADRYTIIRLLPHPGVNYGTSTSHRLTGHMHPSPGTLRHPVPTDLPSIGSAAARFFPPPAELPAFVQLSDLQGRPLPLCTGRPIRGIL